MCDIFLQVLQCRPRMLTRDQIAAADLMLLLLKRYKEQTYAKRKRQWSNIVKLPNVRR